MKTYSKPQPPGNINPCGMSTIHNAKGKPLAITLHTPNALAATYKLFDGKPKPENNYSSEVATNNTNYYPGWKEENESLSEDIKKRMEWVKTEQFKNEIKIY